MAIYVIYTQARNEHKVEARCREKILLPDEDVYVPLYDREKKRNGEIRIVRDVLFPGYIFYETEHERSLKERLKRIEEMSKLLGAGDEIVPLYADEERLVRKLCGKAHVLDISRGYMAGGRVSVIQGPLMGFDGLIRKVNRKKRTAVIEVELLQRRIEVTVGFEVID